MLKKTVFVKYVFAIFVVVFTFQLCVQGETILDGNADINWDKKVNLVDFSVLASKWLMMDCNELNDWCEWADINRSGEVDINDLTIMAEKWMEGTSWQENGSVGFLLPKSSHYEGFVYYDKKIQADDGSYSYMRGRIDFDVYDTAVGNEWADAGFVNPGTGRYVYAYQIFNDYESSQVAIEAFTILGLNGETLSINSGSMGSIEDPLGGQDAGCTMIDSTSTTWYFPYYDERNYIIKSGDHSVYLLFSSDYDWRIGTCQIYPYPSGVQTPPGCCDGGGGEDVGNVGDEVVTEPVEIPVPLSL